MDSIERLVRRTPSSRPGCSPRAEERATVFSRVEALAHRDRMVGFAWSALKEAYYGEHGRSLLILEYDILAQRPAETLRLIYEFLDEPALRHDFEAVEYAEPEFDAQLATPGPAHGQAQVAFEPRRTILPPDLFQKYTALSFWREPAGSTAFRITVQPEPPADPRQAPASRRVATAERLARSASAWQKQRTLCGTGHGYRDRRLCSRPAGRPSVAPRQPAPHRALRQALRRLRPDAPAVRRAHALREAGPLVAEPARPETAMDPNTVQGVILRLLRRRLVTRSAAPRTSAASCSGPDRDGRELAERLVIEGQAITEETLAPLSAASAGNSSAFWPGSHDRKRS
jgi:hypothetical protein